MPISFFVPQAAQSEWIQVLGEAWFVGVGFETGTPGFQSDGGELAIEVDSPWAADLNITGIRVTFTGVPTEVYFSVLPNSGPPQATDPYTSLQEVVVDINPSDPLYALYFDSNSYGGGPFEVTSIEFLTTPAEPIDPETLVCTDYTDDKYWDSSSSIGTFVDELGWYTVDDAGDEVLTLIPPGITPSWTTGWNEGYQPQYARIFFTGPSTVDVVMLQKEESGFEDTLVSEEGYSSGDVLTLDGAYLASVFKLSSIYVGNSPGTSQIIVTSILLCYGPLECQEWGDSADSQDFPTKYPPLNKNVTMSVLPSSFGTLQYFPYYDSDVAPTDNTAYPISVNSPTASAFTVTGASAENPAFSKSTTGGSLTGLAYNGFYDMNSPLKITVENEEVGSECDIFNIQLGADVQDSTSSFHALANPGITLNEANDTWDAQTEIYVGVAMSVESDRHGCVQYLGDGGPLGGYDITVRSFDLSNEFTIAVYDLNDNYSDGASSVSGQAEVFVNYPGGTNGFKVLINNTAGQNTGKYRIFFPQPF